MQEVGSLENAGPTGFQAAGHLGTAGLTASRKQLRSGMQMALYFAALPKTLAAAAAALGLELGGDEGRGSQPWFSPVRA